MITAEYVWYNMYLDELFIATYTEHFYYAFFSKDTQLVCIGEL